jgi:cytochrome c oxidase subunit IV
VAANEHEHEHSSLPYYVVWLALAFFTWLTWFTGRMHLGTWALPLALVIAITKSSLVILFFMHLWEQKGVNRLVIVTSFVFVTLIISLTVADVATRFPLATPAGAPFGDDLPAQLREGPAPEYQPYPGPEGKPPPGLPEPGSAPPEKKALPH